jgi:hypothetical protein
MLHTFSHLKTLVEDSDFAAALEGMREDLVKVEQLLAEHGLEIVDDDFFSYGETLLALAEAEEGLSLDEKDFFGKVGKLTRKLAYKIGTAQGKVKGVKDRWSAFKNSVAAANQGGYDRGYKSTATDQTVKNTPKGTRPKGWKQQAQQQSFKAKNRGAKVGDRSTRKDGSVWQKDKDGSWTQVMGSGKKKQPKLRLVKPLAASAELGDLEARLDEIVARMGRN